MIPESVLVRQAAVFNVPRWNQKLAACQILTRTCQGTTAMSCSRPMLLQGRGQAEQVQGCMRHVQSVPGTLGASQVTWKRVSVVLL